jgi:protein arginine kinase activator
MASQVHKVFVSVVFGKDLTSKAMSITEAKVNGIFDPLAYDLLDSGPVAGSGKSAETCPTCGYSRLEFERRGKFGCPHCYEAFKDLLPDLLKRLHMGLQHNGKVPRSSLTPEFVERRRVLLQNRIAAAVAEESYEDAAAIRDELLELEARAPASGEASS